MLNQSEGKHDLVDHITTPDIDLPEDYQEGKKWQGLASSLADLYMQYRRGVAKLEVMPTSVVSATPSVFASQDLVEPATALVQLDVLSPALPLVHPSASVDLADAQVQAAMSKTQYQLTIEEGKLWERLTDLGEAVDPDESQTVTILASLQEKSSFMVQSYLRRNNPPTEVTYEESKDILHAMGVPCIESTGPYEAEALASSLVLNGCADYVASEDTVRITPCMSALAAAPSPPPHLFSLSIPCSPTLPRSNRTFSYTGRLSSATSRAETKPSCSSRVPRCSPRSTSTHAPLSTLRSCSERISPPAFGTLDRTGRCNTSANTAR